MAIGPQAQDTQSPRDFAWEFLPIAVLIWTVTLNSTFQVRPHLEICPPPPTDSMPNGAMVPGLPMARFRTSNTFITGFPPLPKISGTENCAVRFIRAGT